MFYAEKLAKTPLTLSLWTINLWRGLENIDADCTYLPRIFCAYHRILHAHTYARKPATGIVCSSKGHSSIVYP